MAEIDKRYKRGMIYTIRNYTDDTLIYVGSTINTLSKRFNKHKEECRYGKSRIKLHSLIENNDWTDWYIELYEQYPCNNKKELDRREGQVIREIGTINKNIAGRTNKEWREENADKLKEKKKEWYEQNTDKIKEKMKEWREQNADKIKEKKKEYYEENADKIKEKMAEKVCCNICSAFSNKSKLVRHQKTKSCMSKIPNNIGIPSDNRSEDL